MRFIFLAIYFLGLTWTLRADPPALQPSPEVSYDQVDVAGGPWKIWFNPHSVDRGTYTLKINLLEIASPQIKVAFAADSTWCAYRIVHAGHLMNSPTGGTGSVVHWDGKPVGTVHGGEVVENVTLSVDGQVISLLGNGKLVFDRNAKWSGARIVLKKTSLIGPFRHEAEFEFSADASSYIVTHRYEATTPITAERFKGYRYVFMQMMPPEFSEWLRIGPDGRQADGHMAIPDPLKTQKDKDKVIWTERARAVACYAPDWRSGVVYAYPEAYEGLSHLVDRGRKDRKFRGILFAQDHYEAGEKLQWRMRCKVFDASSAEWQTQAVRLAHEPF